MLDTNVIASAFRSRNGASNALLRLAAEGRVTMLCSTALFLEYESVLSRDSMREVTGQTLQDVATAMAVACGIGRAGGRDVPGAADASGSRR